MLISTSFDNGAMAVVRESAPGVFDLWPYRAEEYGKHLELEPRRPQDREQGETGAHDGANMAFHFRLEGCKGKKAVLRFHVSEIKERSGTSVIYANPDFPVWSTEGETWHRVPRKSLHDDPEIAGGRIVVAELEPPAEPVWVAFQYPYSNDRLAAYMARALRTPYCTAEACGKSIEGRDVPMLTITDPTARGHKKTVWFTGIQHCAETGAGWGLEGVADFLLSADPEAVRARRQCVVRLVPIVNVDGVAEGRGRLHPRNLNLNREWEKERPAAEVAGIRDAMDRWVAQGNGIELFIDIHGFSALPDRNWVILPLANGSFPEATAGRAKRYEQCLCRSLPLRLAPSPQHGYAAGMAARRYSAAAFSIDGYVFRWPTVGASPDLASHYEAGCEVWPLEEIKAAGGVLMRAILECLAGD